MTVSKSATGGDPKQIRAFKKKARELDCGESEEAFDKALGKIGRAKVEPKPRPKQKRKKAP